MFIYLQKNKTMNENLDTNKMNEAAYTLKAISNGTRLCVISLEII